MLLEAELLDPLEVPEDPDADWICATLGQKHGCMAAETAATEEDAVGESDRLTKPSGDVSDLKTCPPGGESSGESERLTKTGGTLGLFIICCITEIITFDDGDEVRVSDDRSKACKKSTIFGVSWGSGDERKRTVERVRVTVRQGPKVVLFSVALLDSTGGFEDGNRHRNSDTHVDREKRTTLWVPCQEKKKSFKEKLGKLLMGEVMDHRRNWEQGSDTEGSRGRMDRTLNRACCFQSILQGSAGFVKSMNLKTVMNF